MESVICGAVAGFVETTICHPLDTIKTRLQSRSGTFLGMLGSGWKTLYRGIFPMYMGVIPKNAVRFTVYENTMGLSGNNSFVSGFTAGVFEAAIVVNPMDMIKIRYQTHSLIAPHEQRPTIMTIIKKEKWRLFSRGAPFTILRQSINQSTNFWAHHTLVHEYGLSSMTAGFFSGAIGPIINNPLDVIKTRLQTYPNRTIPSICHEILSTNGPTGFYRGLGPRLTRIMPGQAITFSVYDSCKTILNTSALKVE